MAHSETVISYLSLDTGLRKDNLKRAPTKSKHELHFGCNTMVLRGLENVFSEKISVIKHFILEKYFDT